MGTGPHAVIVTGGLAPSLRALDSLSDQAFVIAADSGYDHAVAAGLRVDLLVGDLDSISSTGRDAAEASTDVELHPRDKDATDTELALHAARVRGARSATIITGGGLGRIDHLLATVTAVTTAVAGSGTAEATFACTLWVGDCRITPLVGPAAVHVDAPIVSLLALDGDAIGVSTNGLRWLLHNETLRFGSSRGVSNELVDPVGHISISAGRLVVLESWEDNT